MKHGSKTLERVILILDLAVTIAKFPPWETVIDELGHHTRQCFFCSVPHDLSHNQNCPWERLNEVY